MQAFIVSRVGACVGSIPMEPVLILYSYDDVCPRGIALHFFSFKASLIFCYQLGSSGSYLFFVFFSILSLSPLYL